MTQTAREIMEALDAEETLEPVAGTDIAATPAEATDDPAAPSPLPPEEAAPTPEEGALDVFVEDNTLEEIKAAPDEQGIVKSVLKGVANGTIKAGESLSKLMAEALNLPIKGFEKVTGGEEGFRFDTMEPVLFEGDGAVQNTTTALTQFGLQYLAGGAVLRGAGVLQGAGAATNVSRIAVQGAYADFTAFRGDEERLSDFLTTFDSPAANNAFTQYLAGDPDDSDVEGRLKNVLEGFVIGTTLDAVMFAARGIGKSRKLLKQGDKEGAAKMMAESNEQIMKLLKENGVDVTAAPPKKVKKVKKPPVMNKNRAKKIIDQEKLKAVKKAVTKGLEDPASVENTGKGVAEVIRKDLFETTDDVITAMDAMADLPIPDFKKWSHAERLSTAQTYGMSVKELQNMVDMGAVNSRALIVSKSMLVDQGQAIVKAINEGLTDDEVLIEIARYQDLSDIFLSFRNESGRVLDSNRIRKSIDTGDMRLMEDFVTSRFGNKQNVQKFKEALRATSGSPAEVNALLKMPKSSIAMESTLELWKNSILSGIRTFNVNLFGSLFNSVLQTPIRLFEGAAGGVRHTMRGADAVPDRVYMGEAAALALGDVMSFFETIQAAGRILKNPKSFKMPLNEADKAETGIVRKISSQYWGMGQQPAALARFISKASFGAVEAQSAQNLMRGAVDAAGSVINTPGNMLNIQDTFIQSQGRRKQTFALAYRKMMDEKTPMGEMPSRFAELLEDRQFLDSIADDIDLFAKRTTFQAPLGEFGNKVRSGMRVRVTPLRIPVFEYLVPFQVTPANIVKQGIAETNPVIAPMTTEFYRKLDKGGVAADEAIGRWAFGSSVAATAASFAMSGNITGSGPQDPEMRKVWLRSNRPYSIKIQKGEDPNGNPIFDFYEYNRVEPLSFIIGGIASSVETMHYNSLINEGKEKDFMDFAASALVALNEATLDKTFFTGVADFFQVMGDPKRYLPAFANRFGTSWVPNISRDIEFMMQDKPYMRDYMSFEDAFKQKIIGKSKEVPVVRNRWGDPIHKDEGWLLGARSYYSPIGMYEGYAESADREMSRLAVEGVQTPDGSHQVFPKALIKMPERAIMKQGVSIPLSSRQYSRLLEIAGKEVLLDKLGTGTPMNFRDTMNHLVESSEIYKKSKDFPATQAYLIDEVSKGFDEAARELLIKEDPALERKVREAEALVLKSYSGLVDDETRLRIEELQRESE